LNLKGTPMDYAIAKRPACSVCGLNTFRHTGWFLVIENRWLDHLKIMSWHSALAAQKDMKSVCCREHLRTLVAHWLSQANLHLPPGPCDPLPVGSDQNQPDLDLDPHSVGRLVGELAVHRESFSRVWSGSPAALEYILDALITIGIENKPHTLECRLFHPPPESTQGLSLQ